MKKGFTLIELLAVIVILAIIALIAPPIILNIINDSREESNKRSVELYGKSVEQAIAKSQLNGTEILAGDLSSSLLSTVEYSGNSVTCTTNKLYEDGGIYLAGCTVGSDTKEYTYGTEQVTTPTTTTIYRWGTETITIGDIVDPTSYTRDASTLGKNYYLKHVLDRDNKVKESYACVLFNGKEACIRGGSADFYGYAENEADWTGNYLILKGLQSEGISCDFSEIDSHCTDESVHLFASSGGRASAYPDALYEFGDCYVFRDGSSTCESF